MGRPLKNFMIATIEGCKDLEYKVEEIDSIVNSILQGKPLFVDKNMYTVVGGTGINVSINDSTLSDADINIRAVFNEKSDLTTLLILIERLAKFVASTCRGSEQ